MTQEPAVTAEMQRKAEEATIEKQHKAEERKLKKEQRLQEFRDNRDPIQDAMHDNMKSMLISMEKTRKWITFMGVILLLSIISGVIILLDNAFYLF